MGNVRIKNMFFVYFRMNVLVIFGGRYDVESVIVKNLYVYYGCYCCWLVLFF